MQRGLQRLHVPQANARLGLTLDARGPVDARGRVQAMVLEMAKPSEQAAVSAFWGSVQADLALPAPVIVVNGSDACQLRLSLLEPVPVP